MKHLKAAGAEQIKKLDDTAIRQYGISSLALMENAGRIIAHEVIRYLGKVRNPLVTVICGTGNNGGDGFVAARHLLNNEIKIKVYLVGKPHLLKADARINYLILRKMKVPVKSIPPGIGLLKKDIQVSQMIVDAVFGFGLNRDITGPAWSVIRLVNSSKKKVLSVDVPSGLDASTGKVQGICVKADRTVTFSLMKKGFFKNEGPLYIGKVSVADIGIPKKLVERVG